MSYAVRAPLALAAAAVAGVGYAAGIERNAFVLRRYDVPVLPPGQAPLTVLHLSDAHMLGRQERKQDFIRSLAAEQPDLVVSTGDNLAGADGIPALLEVLEAYRGTPGIFVLGSNDYYAPRPKNPLKYFRPRHKRVVGNPLPWRDLVDGFEDLGWSDLTNARRTITVAGRRVEVAGVDDPHLKRDRLAVADAPVDPNAAVHLALVHAPEPRALDRFERSGFDLLLSGHTHGGQLRVPGIGALVTNCGLDRARARGLSRHGNAWLHVSAGLGTSPYAPVRFACRPEASLLTLTPRDDNR
ncbi:MAG TPA: metallophosphoesterase [Frankiaceae bacterium]|nr:metallophosphoesterase [Frankiaceae bacterium]